jgi:peptidoglycan hydrolase-like protein with peptidoglycan-binding domain
MIYNHFEYHERDNFEPTPYAGSSPHEEHIHFEFAWTNAADENTTFDYRLDEIGDADMFLPTNNSTGEEVKFWQHMLEELGFTPGEIDGEYGPKTQAAVAAFRKSLGVTTNYTYLTSWTAFAMFRALAEKYAGKDGEPGKNGKDGKDGADGQNGTLTGTLSVTGGSLNVEAV